MTVVEFYDRDSAQNIVGALLQEPDRVVFLGDSEKQMKKSVEIYREITSSRYLDIEFVIKKTAKNDLLKIRDTLAEIVEEYDDCIFDLGGGEDLFLVAAGMVYEQYKDRIQLQKFNVLSSVLADCDDGSSRNVSDMVRLTVEENIRLYGGKILYGDKREGGTFDWDIDEEFADDIFVMWSVCRADPTKWNRHTHAMGLMDNLFRKPGTLEMKVNPEEAEKRLSEKGDSYCFFKDLMSTLGKYGLIKNLVYKNDGFSFSYKNEKVRKCLTKAGQILELYVTVKALGLCDNDGEPYYNDVMTGVFIDWDAKEPGEDEANIANEIDIILMKDMVPVFISCKNGAVSVDELYKLSSVAKKFGGNHAKRVLVATNLDKMGSTAKYIRARARDMKIRVIENVHKQSEAEIERAVKSLYHGM